MSTRAAMLEELKASYVTSSPRARGWARISPNLGFYRRVASTVLRASEYARDGRMTHVLWAQLSGEIKDAFERSGVPIIVENLEVFERCQQPAVIIGNHMSTTETFLPPYFLVPFRPITFVVKQALVEYPIFKHIMRATDPVVVGRKDPRQDLRTVLDEGKANLERGVSVIIFPQRTRTVHFNPEEFNSIGVKLARNAGVPVIPFAVKTDAWSTGKRLKDFGPLVADRPIHLAFGEPMEVTGNGKAQNDAVVRFILDRLAGWEAWDQRWRAAR